MQIYQFKDSDAKAPQEVLANRAFISPTHLVQGALGTRHPHGASAVSPMGLENVRGDMEIRSSALMYSASPRRAELQYSLTRPVASQIATQQGPPPASQIAALGVQHRFK